ncbi:MAG: outer membrane beta-barrel protein, partial [Proteobacteria bacterium]|nr:outer membrane beta-barrel protein [Pseudomonadota bacterium]
SRSVNETVYENNSSYISTGGGANVTFLTLRMLALGADVSYFLLQYGEANIAGDKRTDKILEISPNLKVDITRWLRAQAGYTLRNRSSNVTDFEYKENRIQASLNAVLLGVGKCGRKTENF